MTYTGFREPLTGVKSAGRDARVVETNWSVARRAFYMSGWCCRPKFSVLDATFRAFRDIRYMDAPAGVKHVLRNIIVRYRTRTQRHPSSMLCTVQQNKRKAIPFVVSLKVIPTSDRFISRLQPTHTDKVT